MERGARSVGLIFLSVKGLACGWPALLLSCASLLSPGFSWGQVRPDAGSIQEQLRPPAAVPTPEIPQIRIEPPPADPKADTPPFFVADFRITGATVFRPEELRALLGEANRPLTLAQVQERAERLTRYYNDHGYVVARALVPAQDVRAGIVEIRVVEGHYGRIDISNATELSETRLRALLGEVREGAIVHGPKLERAVLLVSDLAGVQAKATLEPGESTGLANLVMEITETRNLEYDAAFDNAGNRVTGNYRLSLGLTLNSPANIGDRLSARVVTSGEKLLSLRIAYDLPIGASGLRGGPYVSQTTYQLGGAFAALDASGTSRAAGLAIAYPLIRSSQLNLRAQASGEARKLEDRIGALSTTSDKSALVAQWGIGGDVRDSFMAGAITAFQLQMTSGRLSIQTPALAASDAAAARTQGSYSKLVLNLNRFQGLTDSLRLVLNYTGQRAFKNLDSSEKFSIGGLSGVRAYPPGEAAGDDAHLLQAELKYQWGELLGGELVPFLFVDAGRSTINHEAFAGFAGSNVRHLSGYGVGAEWSKPAGLVLRAWWAFKHGQEAATAGADRSSRLWFQAGVLF